MTAVLAMLTSGRMLVVLVSATSGRLLTRSGARVGGVATAMLMFASWRGAGSPVGLLIAPAVVAVVVAAASVLVASTMVVVADDSPQLLHGPLALWLATAATAALQLLAKPVHGAPLRSRAQYGRRASRRTNRVAVPRVGRRVVGMKHLVRRPRWWLRPRLRLRLRPGLRLWLRVVVAAMMPRALAALASLELIATLGARSRA